MTSAACEHSPGRKLDFFLVAFGGVGVVVVAFTNQTALVAI